MGVVGVTGLFNSLQFGNVNSADYGVFITGEAVYNAPERAVEFVEVPGRNGALVLDQGHWQNIEVTYPASIAGDSQADFRDAVSGFRNAVMAQTGYQRLTDTYNPDEYRLATSAAGFEIKPVFGGRAGEFEIMFNCMPQRWLLSGETPVTISTSGQVLTNPTLHNSSPLIVAEGYGKIGMNGFEPEIYNVTVGTIQIASSWSRSYGLTSTGRTSFSFDVPTSSFLPGDSIQVSGATFRGVVDPSVPTRQPTTVSFTAYPEMEGASLTVTMRGEYHGEWAITLPDITFNIGTSQSVVLNYYGNIAAGLAWDMAGSIGIFRTDPEILDFSVTYDADNSTITISSNDLITTEEFLRYHGASPTLTATMAAASIIGTSTKPLVSGEVYIDTELGEAYVLIDGEATSINNMIAFGSDLPTLAPGDNPITKDSTITSLKITPRWWRL